MRIEGFASERQYVDHLLPVWTALRPEERGSLFVSTDAAFKRCVDHGIAPDSITYASPRGEGLPVLVASFSDLRDARRRSVALLEHGSGQSYVGVDNGSYSGGAERERVRLFLCPNQQVAQRNHEKYPAASVAVIGSPILDKWHTRPIRPEPETIAISWHWECRIVPETRPALDHFREVLPLVCERWKVIGHGHPRHFSRLRKMWLEVGAEPVEHFDEVMERARLYVCDNSSSLPEFASTRRPVVFLSAPWYRRDVNHGGRFWDWPQGQVHVEEPDQLLPGIAQALLDPPEIRQARQRMVQTVYAHTDGLASQRAAEAIREVFGA